MTGELKRTKRKLKRFYIVFFSIVMFVPLIIFGYVQYQFYNVKQATIDHLLSNEYGEQDILEIKGNHIFGPGFAAQVIFKDEPDVVYNFSFDSSGKKILNLGPHGSSGVDDPRNYKHYDEEELY